MLSHNLCYIYTFSSAVDSRTGTKVAIKKLYRPFQSELFAKRSYRELRLLKHIKHENVRHNVIVLKGSKLLRLQYFFFISFFIELRLDSCIQVV